MMMLASLPLSYFTKFTAMCMLNCQIVTKSAKTGLICTKYTYSFYHILSLFCVGYTISVSFIKFLRNFFVYGYVRKKSYILNLKGSKLGQILHANKTGFCRLGHNFKLIKLKRFIFYPLCQG